MKQRKEKKEGVRSTSGGGGKKAFLSSKGSLCALEECRALLERMEGMLSIRE